MTIIEPRSGRRAPPAAAASSEMRLKKNESTKFSEIDSARLMKRGQATPKSPLFITTDADGEGDSVIEPPVMVGDGEGSTPMITDLGRNGAGVRTANSEGCRGDVAQNRPRS